MMGITWSASCVLNRGGAGVSSLCSLSRWSRAVTVLVHFTLVCVWVSAHCLGCSVFLALPWWSGIGAEVAVAHRLSQLGTFLRTSSCSSLLFVFLLFLVPFLPFNFWNWISLCYYFVPIAGLKGSFLSKQLWLQTLYSTKTYAIVFFLLFLSLTTTATTSSFSSSSPFFLPLFLFDFVAFLALTSVLLP